MFTFNRWVFCHFVQELNKFWYVGSAIIISNVIQAPTDNQMPRGGM